MKIALGIIARPVESLLVLCLRPVIAHFDGLVMLTSPNPSWMPDVPQLNHEPRTFHLFESYRWINDYAHARNTLIAHAEELGYEWLMMLDADESMLPDDLVTLRKYTDHADNIIIPRYEFVDDFNHFCPWFYPDWHPRLFKLNMGYHYVSPVHESLVCGPLNTLARDMPGSVTVPMCPIFHYGKSKTPEETWLKYDTYPRIAAGLPPRTEIPPGTVMPETWALDKKKVPFLGNKPL